MVKSKFEHICATSYLKANTGKPWKSSLKVLKGSLDMKEASI